jgi:hypothetical protein
MSRKTFVEVVEKLFAENSVDAVAVEYFSKNFLTAKTNSKEVERASAIKAAIMNVLVNAGTALDRYEIADKAILELGDVLKNEKGGLAYNSITAHANALVEAGMLTKQEVKIGKAKRMKYRTA